MSTLLRSRSPTTTPRSRSARAACRCSARPRLLAWCEAATCAEIEPVLAEGETSVGTRIQLEHLAASPVGAEVEVTATTAYVDGRLHRFTVAARHTSDGKVVASGEVTRVVVDAERFMAGRISPSS